jgi:SAM-dependent methyltransferase
MTQTEANALRFDGLADGYDANRPAPPLVLVDLLCRYAGVSRPSLVVDLGCGTGLSTRIWLGRADAILGVEPGDAMRRRACEATAAISGGQCISYRTGYSEATGVAAGCADIVTCSQSLHWMEPDPTFAEATRILRPGGVFAAIDVDMTPSFGGPAEEAFLSLRRRARALEETLRPTPVRRWDKAGHLERMTASGLFRFTRQVMAHHVEPGSGERLVGLALSMGGVATLTTHGLTESEFGMDVLRREAAAMGTVPVPFHWSYVMRLGVK